MGNWIVMTQSLDRLAALSELLRPDLGPGSGDGTLAGQPIIDVSHGISFMGISQGHILGGTLAAVLPQLDRVVLHVGGAGLSHYIFRAEPFRALLELISRHFKRPIEQYAWAAGSQRVFDRIDPGHYARHLLRDPLPGASPRRVLMQIGIGDIAVPNFGAYFHARAIGTESDSSWSSPLAACVRFAHAAFALLTRRAFGSRRFVQVREARATRRFCRKASESVARLAMGRHHILRGQCFSALR